MVYITSLDLPEGLPITNTYIIKAGNRREYKLDTTDPFVQRIVNDLHIQKPLRFASLMEALPESKLSQTFHIDSNDAKRTNAIVYLSDVKNESNGPIEFEGIGPVLGTRGTTAVYSSSEVHRGVANTSPISRYALTMAFSEDETFEIHTIGGSLLTPSEPTSRQNVLFGVVLAVVALYLYYYNDVNALILLVGILLFSSLYSAKLTEPTLRIIDLNGAALTSYVFTNGTEGFNTLRFKFINCSNYNTVTDVNVTQVNAQNLLGVDLRTSSFNMINGPTEFSNKTTQSRLYNDTFTGNISANTIYQVYFPAPVDSFTFSTNYAP